VSEAEFLLRIFSKNMIIIGGIREMIREMLARPFFELLSGYGMSRHLS
jgi:hypothetical protein